jgi:DNA repair exonuclease SbcCD ATPase subunit
MVDDKGISINMENLEELLEEFHKHNKNSNYTQKDLIKSLFSAIDRLDDKIDTQMSDFRDRCQDTCNKLSETLNNHVSHIQTDQSILAQRTSKLEATLSTLKYIMVALLLAMSTLIIESIITIIL